MGMGVGIIILAVVTMITQMVFLPLSQRFGYSTATGAWLVGSIFFVAFVQRFLPETKGQTLEEIEAGFAGSPIGCKSRGHGQRSTEAVSSLEG